MCVLACARLCVRACVCLRARVCACVCVLAGENARGMEGQRDCANIQREGGHPVCVCLRARVCVRVRA